MYQQFAIALFGVAAIYLSQQNDQKLNRYACLCGLMAQPFWLFASYHAEQWGIFLVSILYAWAWALGFRNYWLNEKSPVDKNRYTK